MSVTNISPQANQTAPVLRKRPPSAAVHAKVEKVSKRKFIETASVHTSDIPKDVKDLAQIHQGASLAILAATLMVYRTASETTLFGSKSKDLVLRTGGATHQEHRGTVDAPACHSNVLPIVSDNSLEILMAELQKRDLSFTPKTKAVLSSKFGKEAAEILEYLETENRVAAKQNFVSDLVKKKWPNRTLISNSKVEAQQGFTVTLPLAYNNVDSKFEKRGRKETLHLVQKCLEKKGDLFQTVEAFRDLKIKFFQKGIDECKERVTKADEFTKQWQQANLLETKYRETKELLSKSGDPKDRDRLKEDLEKVAKEYLEAMKGAGKAFFSLTKKDAAVVAAPRLRDPAVGHHLNRIFKTLQKESFLRDTDLEQTESVIQALDLRFKNRPLANAAILSEVAAFSGKCSEFGTVCSHYLEGVKNFVVEDYFSKLDAGGKRVPLTPQKHAEQLLKPSTPKSAGQDSPLEIPKVVSPVKRMKPRSLFDEEPKT